jgi:two-component system response regulator LytT
MDVLVIEDEELAVRKLTKLLQDVDNSIRIVGTAASVRASVQWLQNNATPDLILRNPAEPETGGKMAIDALVQQLRQQIQPAEYRKRFLVKHLSQWMPVEVADIAYFYSEEGVSLFRTRTNQKFSVDYTLDELEAMLDPLQFFRANRQFIVDINCVQQIHPYFNNKLKLTLKPAPEEEVLVSRERATEFKKWMGK